MKHVVSIVSFMLLTFMPVMSQVQDFKTKNSSNQAQRTQMLDALRGEVKKLIRQEVVFVVDHLKCHVSMHGLRVLFKEKTVERFN
jgi:hypothetical protein